MTLRLLTLMLLALCAFAGPGLAFELHPLITRNLSPATLGFGLPAVGAAQVLASHTGEAQVVIDLVSNSSGDTTAGEALVFDGETYRAVLGGDYGLGAGLEVGFELPLLSHQGGFLDNFIEGWHSAFGLPQGERRQTLDNQLDYRYVNSDGLGFSRQSHDGGLGDLVLRGAWQLWHDPANLRAVALRASLKLPTGSADKLTGSGGTDLALWLSGEQRLQTSAGQVLLYGGGGGMFSGAGDLLAAQRRELVGFVSLGCGWQPWSRLGFQLQFDGHSPFYRQSNLRQLSAYAGQLAIGGSLAMAEKTALELAVVEDVVVDTAPDVVFHLALRHRF